MVRPLVVDVLGFVLPMLLGGLFFFAGTQAQKGAWWRKSMLIAIALGVIVGNAIAMTRLLPIEIRPVFYLFGGDKVVLIFAALFFLGIAWKSPRRSFSPSFLGSLALISGMVIGIEASARLWWRFVEKEAWKFPVVQNGGIKQTSGKTCGPASAVMLLNHYGIKVSEGEMAYLADTSWFGSDCYALTQAINAKLVGTGWTAQLGNFEYLQLIHKKTPFVAQLRQGALGYHAIYVEQLGYREAVVIDPQDGEKTLRDRSELLRQWDGTAIYLVKNTSTF